MSNAFTPSNGGKAFVTPGSGSDSFDTNSNLSRTLPRQMSTGSTRGTQTVGYGNAKLDGTNNRITVGTPDGGSVGLGSVPGSTTNEFGFFTVNSQGNVTYKVVNGVQYFYDDSGNLIQKVQAGTTYVYNPSDNFVNVTQSGLLPDKSGGFVAAQPGQNVSDAYS